MTVGLLGRKIGMTQIFDAAGKVIPVTLIEAGPCQVVQRKTKEKEGYQAIQLGFMEKKEKRTTKPLQGHFKKAGVKPQKVLKEFHYIGDDYQVGQVINLDIFEGIDFVDITGISKGKGFAGAMKRWKFHGGPATHGSMTHRILGSIGSTDAARVFKGRRMPGRMGGVKETLQNSKIVKRDLANNLLIIKGAVPGAKGTLLIIKKAIKKKHKSIEKKAEEKKAEQKAEEKKLDKKKPEKKG